MGLGYLFAENQDCLKDANDAIVADPQKRLDLVARNSVALHFVDLIVAC